MANLVELSNQLEYVPQEQLVQMSQDPNSMYPSFLVLSEIQRRNQMKKMYEAQQPKPQTTVAEEVVQEFAGQQGLQGAMAQSPGPQNAFQPGDMGNMAPPSPMQAMASGGRTGYQAGRNLTLEDTFTNPNEVSIEEKDAVDKNFGQLYEQYGAPTLKAIGALNEDGSINYVGSALALASINPAFRLGKAAVGLGGRFINRFAPKLLEKGKNLVTKPGQKIPNPALKTGMKYGDNIIDPKTGAKIPQVITGPRTLKMPTVKGIGSFALPTLVVDRLIQSGMSSAEAEREAARLKAEEEAKQLNILLEEQNRKEAEEKAKQEAAIQAQIEAEKNQRGADMLVGLGGAIMSAKNVGELGTGISDAYFGVQSKKDAKDLAGLQGRLLEAQAAKYEADVSNMPLESVLTSLSIAEKQLKSLQDSGDAEAAGELILYIDALNKRSAELQGITFAQKNKRNELLGLVEELG